MKTIELSNSINYPSVFDLSDEDKEWIETTLKSMPVYEKCAQVIMPIVTRNEYKTDSPEYNKILELVRDHGIGGLIVSSGNLKEVVNLINVMQSNAKIPLLISADFETGLGMRIDSTNKFPHNMAVGATDDPDYAYEMGKAIAVESRLMGVQINFAPVADVNNNPLNPVINLRSFSEDKDAVSDFCSSLIEGAQEINFITCAKHFPGHGNTTIDSHKDLPLIRGSKEYLLENELKPFIASIEAGVQSVMIGHLEVPGLENTVGLPASLSYSIITKLLKEELGFDGLVITDALDMQAITNYFSTEQAVVKAFLAGNDILLMPDNTKLAIESLYNSVKSNEISEQRLDESVRKILAAKRWIGLTSNKITDTVNLEKRINIPIHKELAQEIADKSITAIKLSNNFGDSYSLTDPNLLLVSLSNRRSFNKPYLEDLLKKENPQISAITLNSQSRENDYKSALKSSKQKNTIVLALYVSVNQNSENSSLSDEQVSFINNLIESNSNIIIISFENPYLLELFPSVKNYICTFSNSEVSQTATLKFLKGELETTGMLPVSIPGTGYKFGYRFIN